MLVKLLSLTRPGREGLIPSVKALRQCTTTLGLRTAKRLRDEVDLEHPVIVELRDGPGCLSRLQEFYAVKPVSLEDLPALDPEKLAFAKLISWLDEMKVFNDNKVLGELCDLMSCSVREANRIIARANEVYDNHLAQE